MNQMSIQVLKAQLSGAVAAAESGATILVTRHGEPVAQLGPARRTDVHWGARAGVGRLAPAVRRNTGRRSLVALLDDRGDR